MEKVSAYYTDSTYTQHYYVCRVLIVLIPEVQCLMIIKILLVRWECNLVGYWFLLLQHMTILQFLYVFGVR